MAKNLERVGDHATNIAENVWFLVHGEQPLPPRESATRPPAPASPDAALQHRSRLQGGRCPGDSGLLLGSSPHWARRACPVRTCRMLL